MKTSNISDCIIVVAIMGVVYYHHTGSFLYIGRNYIPITDLLNFLNEHGWVHTLAEIFQGVSAIVGLFFINSGYGLSKRFNGSIREFYKKRFFKIYLYAALCAVICSAIVFIIDGRMIFSYWSSFLPVFGFYEFHRDAALLQYWFLANIFVYYLIFPFLYFKYSNRKYLLILLVVFLFGELTAIGIIPSFTTLYHSTIFRLPEFMLGIFIARNASIEKLIFKKSARTLFAGLIIFLCGYVFLYNRYLHLFVYFLSSIGIYVVLAQLFLFIQIDKEKMRLIKKLRAGTFTLYLLHLASMKYLFDLLCKDVRPFLELYNTYIPFMFDVLFVVAGSLLFMFAGGIVEKRYNTMMQRFV